MMKSRLTKIALLAGLGLAALLPASSALAHHSFSIYDLENPIIITGVLKELEFRNPHTILIVEQDKEDGVSQEIELVWTIESMAPRRWDSEVGVRDIGNVGDEVTIRGWPAVNGGLTMALGTITSPSGVTLVRERILQNDRNNRSGGRR